MGRRPGFVMSPEQKEKMRLGRIAKAAERHGITEASSGIATYPENEAKSSKLHYPIAGYVIGDNGWAVPVFEIERDQYKHIFATIDEALASVNNKSST